MWNTFKYTILSLLKEKSVLFWALAFPIFLSTIFFAMFSNLDENFQFEAIPVAIINDANYEGEETFSELIVALSESGEDQMLETHFVNDEASALLLLKDATAVGYFQVEKNGDPKLVVSTESDINWVNTLNQTILKNLLSSYLHKKATIETLAKENPTALMDQSFIQSLYEQRSYTNDISIVANEATTTVRYFYALLGFASIMAAMIGMVAIVRTQANLSALGARRSVGATSRTKTLVATLAAAWLVSYVCLLVAFCYMRFVLGINFGRDIESMLGLLVASFMTCGLGAFIGAIPKLGEGSKSGILSGLSCLMSLFAGLYGEPTMALADNLAKNAPVIQLLNPARQVTELFYSLYYYDTYESFFTTILILLISGAVLFICAAVFMRRQRYASL